MPVPFLPPSLSLSLSLSLLLAGRLYFIILFFSGSSSDFSSALFSHLPPPLVNFPCMNNGTFVSVRCRRHYHHHHQHKASSYMKIKKKPKIAMLFDHTCQAPRQKTEPAERLASSQWLRLRRHTHTHTHIYIYISIYAHEYTLPLSLFLTPHSNCVLSH